MCYTEDALLAIDSDDFVMKKNLYEKMGDGACALQNYGKAIDYYLKMLEMAESGHFDKKELIPVYVSLYQTYTDLKQYDDALLYLRKEQELNRDDPKESVTTLIQIGDVYDLSGKGFWEVENVYQEARTGAQKLNDLKLEKRIGLKQLALRKKHKMSTLVDILVDELKMSGIDVDVNEIEIEDVNEESSQGSDFEKNTPDIGEDVCLSDISGSDCDDTANTSGSRTRKKRGQSLAVKRNEKGETQLHQACISGNMQQVIRLIDQGHPVNIRDHAGWTPLHEASNHGHHEIVKTLLERGANINDKGGKSCDGITALHDACVNGCLEVVEVLLDHGAQPTLRTDFNDTALDSLEKWRETAELNTSEQIFYDVIKERIVKMLNTAGCVDVVTPVDNSSRKRSTGSLPNSAKKSSRIGPLRNSAFVYSDSEEEGEDSETVNMAETVDDIMNKEFPPTDIDAPNEYRSAIENVRKLNRLSLPSPRSSFESKRKTGLLSNDEVGEGWLEVDMRTTKKRKLSSITRTLSYSDANKLSPAKTLSKNKFNYSDTDRSKENIAVVDLFENDNPVDAYSIHDDDSHDAFDILMSNAATICPSNRKRRISSSETRNRNNITGKQPTLLSNGFTKTTQSSTSFIENTSSYSSAAMTPKKSSPIATKMASIKVKVEDQSLNVPVSNIEDLTVGWLGKCLR